MVITSLDGIHANWDLSFSEVTKYRFMNFWLNLPMQKFSLKQFWSCDMCQNHAIALNWMPHIKISALEKTQEMSSFRRHVSRVPIHPTKEFYFWFQSRNNNKKYSIERKQQLKFLISFRLFVISPIISLFSCVSSSITFNSIKNQLLYAHRARKTKSSWVEKVLAFESRQVEFDCDWDVESEFLCRYCADFGAHHSAVGGSAGFLQPSFG